MATHTFWYWSWWRNTGSIGPGHQSTHSLLSHLTRGHLQRQICFERHQKYEKQTIAFGVTWQMTSCLLFHNKVLHKQCINQEPPKKKIISKPKLIHCRKLESTLIQEIIAAQFSDDNTKTASTEYLSPSNTTTFNQGETLVFSILSLSLPTQSLFRVIFKSWI